MKIHNIEIVPSRGCYIYRTRGIAPDVLKGEPNPNAGNPIIVDETFPATFELAIKKAYNQLVKNKSMNEANDIHSLQDLLSKNHAEFMETLIVLKFNYESNGL